MPPHKGLSLKEKIKLLEGMVIFSREFGVDVIIDRGSVYTHSFLDKLLLIAKPTEHMIDMLCDDMFYSEFGVEPDEEAIELMAIKEFDIKDIIN